MAKPKLKRHPEYDKILQEFQIERDREVGRHNGNLANYAFFLIRLMALMNGTAVIVLMTFLGTDIFADYVVYNRFFDDLMVVSILGFLLSFFAALRCAIFDFFKEDYYMAYFNEAVKKEKPVLFEDGKKYRTPYYKYNEALASRGNMFREKAILHGRASIIIFGLSALWVTGVFAYMAYLT